MPRVAITGANGFVGAAAAQTFATAGWDVVRLVRQPDPDDVLYRLDRSLVPGTLTGVDVVLHCAYAPEDVALNVTGAEKVLEAIARDGAGRLIFLSSLSARAGSRTAYGQQKRLIEQLVDPERDAIVRPGLVTGDGGLFGRTIAQVRKTHLLPLIGGGRQPVQPVDVADLAEGLVRIAGAEQAGTWVIAAPDPITVRELYRRAAGVRVLPLPIPYGVATLLARAGMGGLTTDNITGLREAQWVAAQDDLARLGLELTRTAPLLG